jgi:hypothetical protein
LILALGLIAIFARFVDFNNRADGATYVVDQTAPGAADSNPGTEQSPFKTIQYAVDTAKAGDKVLVMEPK